MRQSSDRFPVVLVLAIAALTFLGKLVFDNLFYASLMRWLEKTFEIPEAEVIAQFSSIALPLFLAGSIIFVLHHYLRHELSQQLAKPSGSFRQIQAQHEATEALRAHTEELARQRESNSPIQRALNQKIEYQLKSSLIGPRKILAQLRTEGVEIRNAGQKPQDDLPAYINKIGDWMERTIAAINIIDEADAEWFRTLDAVPPARVPLGFPLVAGEESHYKAFREHDFRLSKLEKLIDRYAATK